MCAVEPKQRPNLTDEERKNLIGQNLDLCYRAAADMQGVMFPNAILDIDDLTSIAFFGLELASKAFDPNAGLKFRTYARYRIKAKLYEALVKSDRVRKRNRILRKRGMGEILTSPYYDDGVEGKRSEAAERAEFEDLISPIPSVRVKKYLRQHFYNGRPCEDIAEECDVHRTSVFKGVQAGIKYLRGFYSRFMTEEEMWTTRSFL